jgi:hypothetical protein
MHAIASVEEMFFFYPESKLKLTIKSNSLQTQGLNS